MPLPIATAVARYNLVRLEVQTRCPESWAETVHLCEQVPAELTPQQFWIHGRDKPCWSNITVDIGRRIASDIVSNDDFNACERIAAPEWSIQMIARGPRWKANENFALVGQSVQNFVQGLQRGGLRSYLWRLYAIRSLAIELSGNGTARTMVERASAAGTIQANDLERWTKQFSRLAGMGWGYVTVYHMLTDLGLSPKPDMHLRRGAIRMGLLEPEVSSAIPEGTLKDPSLDHRVVLAVIELAQHIEPMACPQIPRSALREVDKAIMEWSRQGLARPL